MSIDTEGAAAPHLLRLREQGNDTLALVRGEAVNQTLSDLPEGYRAPPERVVNRSTAGRRSRRAMARQVS